MQRAEEFRYLILAAQREGDRILTEVLRPFDLTSSQFEVLRVLQECQPLSLTALGDLLVCESGSPSRLVNGLVEATLINRVPSTTDARMVTLTLTPSGEQLLSQASAAEAALYEFMLRTLDESSLAACSAVLWRFITGRPAGEALARRIRAGSQACEDISGVSSCTEKRKEEGQGPCSSKEG